MIEELVDAHRGLVRAIAHKLIQDLHLPARPQQLDDLVSFGDGGLFEAARRFDPTRGVLFATFATYRIRGAMVDGLRAVGWHRRGSAEVHMTSLDAAREVGDDRPSPEETVVQHQLLGLLREAVASLKEAERRLIVGYFFEGMTLEDLGREIGGLSKSWTCRLLAKALARLREGIGQT